MFLSISKTLGDITFGITLVCLKPKWLSYHTTDLTTSKFFIPKTQEGVKWE